MIEFERPNIECTKIDGVLHEFSSVPNVVEDVPEIIVNLKNVRLKFDGNEEKVHHLQQEKLEKKQQKKQWNMV